MVALRSEASHSHGTQKGEAIEEPKFAIDFKGAFMKLGQIAISDDIEILPSAKYTRFAIRATIYKALRVAILLVLGSAAILIPLVLLINTLVADIM